MISYLSLTGVGPASEMSLSFGERLNVITGDNGLGKSFLLDIAFWAMTRRWPAELNARLVSGRIALPRHNEEGEISFAFTGKTALKQYSSRFDRRAQAWTGPAGRPANPGLVLYAMADGGFALWDPARNYWLPQGGADVPDRRQAYVFSAQEVWDGLSDSSGVYCNGLIRDLANWQREQGAAWQHFSKVLNALSPDSDEPLIMGTLTRISLNDARDMPTLRLPYGIDVPVVHASAGMRRILALAYLLVWAWHEHQQAARLLGEPDSRQLVFLVDEIESHLHPRWQFKVIAALMGVMEQMASEAQVQLIVATHSAQVLASLEALEPAFDSRADVKLDAWFDLDYVSDSDGRRVNLTEREFEKHGTVSNWLTSEAFDLESDRAPTIAQELTQAAELLDQERPAQATLQATYQRLLSLLNPKDPFLFRWRAVAERKGLTA